VGKTVPPQLKRLLQRHEKKKVGGGANGKLVKRSGNLGEARPPFEGKKLLRLSKKLHSVETSQARLEHGAETAIHASGKTEWGGAVVF